MGIAGKSLRWTVAGILTAALVLAVAAWLSPRRPNARALEAMDPTAEVSVAWSDAGKWLEFSPVEPKGGLILYPGSKVRPEAYAALTRAIAEEGYLVIVPKMPVNLAIFGWKTATDVIAAYPGIKSWTIGGHSLGGAMASRYVINHPGEMDGLVLWASFPAESWDLSELDIRVASIYGSLDGLASVEEVLETRPNLPPDTQWVEIEGGNHAQFGDYGEQKGDLPAVIPPADQQAQVVIATVDLLDIVGE